MKTFNIILPTVEDVKNFSDAAADSSFNINIVRDRYVIDAKSIMGLFCLDLTKPVRVEADTKDEDAFGRFYKKVERYVSDRPEDHE